MILRQQRMWQQNVKLTLCAPLFLGNIQGDLMRSLQDSRDSQAKMWFFRVEYRDIHVSWQGQTKKTEFSRIPDFWVCLNRWFRHTQDTQQFVCLLPLGLDCNANDFVKNRSPTTFESVFFWRQNRKGRARIAFYTGYRFAHDVVSRWNAFDNAQTATCVTVHVVPDDICEKQKRSYSRVLPNSHFCLKLETADIGRAKRDTMKPATDRLHR